MNLLFTYEFGGRPSYYINRFGEEEDDGLVDTEEFEFEADYKDALNYLIRTHGYDDLIRDYIDNGFYEAESDENKETLKSYDGFDGTYDSIRNMSEETKKDFIEEVFLDVLINGEPDIYHDELKDYFEQEAYDIWSDL